MAFFYTQALEINKGLLLGFHDVPEFLDVHRDHLIIGGFCFIITKEKTRSNSWCAAIPLPAF
jgi:hypothetical protein